MADTSIKKTEIIKKQVSLNTTLKEKTKTQEITPSNKTLSDAEIEAKLNQIINDIQHGNISVDDAVAALLELGIVAEVITQNFRTTFKFMFKGKQYTIFYTPRIDTSIAIDGKADKIDTPAVKIDGPISSKEPKTDISITNSEQITDKPFDIKFYDSYLETYRKQLSELYCPDDIYDDIMKKLGNELYSYVSKNGVINLRKHLNEVFNDLVKVLDGRENLNTDILFGDKEELNVSEFMEFIEKLGSANETFSEQDSAVFQKLNELIQGLKDKYSIQNSYDEEDLIKCIMILMNQAAGVENKGNVTITQDAIKNLNKSNTGFFETLDKILNTDDNLDDGIDAVNIDKLYYFGIDRYIDNFGQGPTGDCWLLASISALSATENGQKVIKDSIEIIKKTDENGNEKEYIRVTFNGIGKSYDVSYEEMVEAKISDCYAYGDKDVLALEIATEKLRRDIDSGEINGPITISIIFDDGSPGTGIDGGQQSHMLYYLTGNSPNVEIAGVSYSELQSIYNDFSTGNYAGYISLGHYGDVSAVTTDDEVFEWPARAYHALAITGMTEDTITIVNPYYSEKQYVFTWEEFLKLKPNMGITSTQESMTLDKFEEKIQGEEFDKNVNGKEIKAYLLLYCNKLINDVIYDMNSKYYNSNEEFPTLLKNFIWDEISGMYDDNEEYNLKDALKELKNVFDELTNSVSKECRISLSGNDNRSHLNRYVDYIVSYVYSANRNNMKYSLLQFREQLIKFVAEQYGKSNVLEQAGYINISELVQNTNEYNSWLDEFYAIVKNFAESLMA